MLNEVFSEKTAQVSLVSGVLFFILGSTDSSKMVSDFMKKTLNVSLSGTPLLVFNSVLFALLVGLLTFNVFRPILGWNAEGQADKPCFEDAPRDADGNCPSVGTDDPDMPDMPDMPEVPCSAADGGGAVCDDPGGGYYCDGETCKEE